MLKFAYSLETGNNVAEAETSASKEKIIKLFCPYAEEPPKKCSSKSEWYSADLTMIGFLRGK